MKHGAKSDWLGAHVNDLRLELGPIWFWYQSAGTLYRERFFWFSIVSLFRLRKPFYHFVNFPPIDNSFIFSGQKMGPEGPMFVLLPFYATV